MIGGQQFYERKEVKDLLAYLRVVLNSQDEIGLRRVLNYPVAAHRRGGARQTRERGQHPKDIALPGGDARRIDRGIGPRHRRRVPSLRAGDRARAVGARPGIARGRRRSDFASRYRSSRRHLRSFGFEPTRCATLGQHRIAAPACSNATTHAKKKGRSGHSSPSSFDFSRSMSTVKRRPKSAPSP